MGVMIAFSSAIFGQGDVGTLRGAVKDKTSGEVLPYGYVKILELNKKVEVDLNGIYTFIKVPVGTYTVFATYGNYDTFKSKVTITSGKITRQNIALGKVIREIGKVKVKGGLSKKSDKEVDIGLTRVTPREIAVLPSVGGEPDLLQYLQVLPGAVFSGDQGGQLYLRGGSPVMNKVLLDGMVIYNPFHSIGLFSVFDADFISSADIYTAGFGAQYGGRISAVVDVKTRNGDLTKVRKKISVNPFTAKFNIEGPIKKYSYGKPNSSYLFSYKTSYLKHTASTFYPYIDKVKLPYTFNDLYGKLSFNSPNGSYFKMFGFHFRDNVDFPNTTSYAWRSSGFGTQMFLLPEASKVKVEANVSYSGYGIDQKEVNDDKPRKSDINAFDLGLNIINSLPKGDFINGIEINSIQTNFEIFNSNDRKITQTEFTTQFGVFSQYKVKTKNSVIDAGMRLQYYPSLGDANFEPRLQYRLTLKKQKLYFKMAVGRYSQNLLSASSDRDVVNLFYGFLSGPNNLPNQFNGKERTHSLQKANHAVAGFDYIIGEKSDITVEGYFKDFTQLTNINRDKLFDNNSTNADKPDALKQDYVLETGQAYGGDFRYRYNNGRFYNWIVYSLNYVTRTDGTQTYSPVFDRRHNINIVTSYYLSRDKKHVTSLRWNYGSGFPFTQTQGFFEKVDFNNNGVSTDYTGQNGDVGVVYGGLNQGRLPQYHRLDFSYKWNFLVHKKYKSQMIVSITNVYDRNNIFYFNRFEFKRVDQLPILPSVGFNMKF
jgi:hypothetical protein